MSNLEIDEKQKAIRAIVYWAKEAFQPTSSNEDEADALIEVKLKSIEPLDDMWKAHLSITGGLDVIVTFWLDDIHLLAENRLHIEEKQVRKMALHWLAVGYISDGAKRWVEECGGQVRQVSDDPRLFLVGIAYNSEGSWHWSKGRQQYSWGIQIWNTGEIQEHTTGISLQYRNLSEEKYLAEYCSAHENYLILPDEEFNVATMAVKPQPQPEPIAAPEPLDWLNIEGDIPGDLNESPF